MKRKPTRFDQLKSALTRKQVKQLKQLFKDGARFFLLVIDYETDALFSFKAKDELAAFTERATPSLFHPEIADAWQKEATTEWESVQPSEAIMAILSPEGTAFKTLCK